MTPSGRSPPVSQNQRKRHGSRSAAAPRLAAGDVDPLAAQLAAAIAGLRLAPRDVPIDGFAPRRHVAQDSEKRIRVALGHGLLFGERREDVAAVREDQVLPRSECGPHREAAPGAVGDEVELREAELGQAIGPGPARRAFEKQDDLTAGREARRARDPGHEVSDLASRKSDGEGLRDASPDRLETRESDERERPRLSPRRSRAALPARRPSRARSRARAAPARDRARPDRSRRPERARTTFRRRRGRAGGRPEATSWNLPVFWRRAYADRPKNSVEHRPAGLAAGFHVGNSRRP